MVGSIGAQIGLLAFAVALFAGLAAGNGVIVVLTRALVVLFVGAIVGQFVGWAAKLVLREYLQKRKLEIDRHHFAEMRTIDPAAADLTEEPAPPNATEVG